MKFYDEHTGEPYFCVVDGRGRKICRVASIGEGDSWIDGIRALMDRSDIMGLGERLVSETLLTETEEPDPDDDIEAIIIYHAYMLTLHRYRVIEAMETRSALLAEQPR